MSNPLAMPEPFSPTTMPHAHEPSPSTGYSCPPPSPWDYSQGPSFPASRQAAGLLGVPGTTYDPMRTPSLTDTTMTSNGPSYPPSFNLTPMSSTMALPHGTSSFGRHQNAPMGFGQSCGASTGSYAITSRAPNNNTTGTSVGKDKQGQNCSCCTIM